MPDVIGIQTQKRILTECLSMRLWLIVLGDQQEVRHSLTYWTRDNKDFVIDNC